MIDLVKKTFLAGIGAAAMTMDRVEQMAREIANSAQLSSEKGQAFVDEAVARAQKARSDLQATVQRMVNDALARTNVATRDDVAQLVARIEKLERELAAKSQ
jgi:polyhydroxyalkanoate synthesis regulator phasin